MSTRAKMSLADFAMQLRDEQLKARVVHYKQELKTSPELDAVTAQVIAELHALRNAAGVREASPLSQSPQARDEIEIELIQSFKQMLGKLFHANKVSPLFERRMAEVTKRFARLFFESELHDRLRGEGSETKTMRFAEQATYHVLARYEAKLVHELAGYDYASPDVLTAARQQIMDLVKEYRNQFLSRTTPELNALVKLLNEVLAQFFTQELPPVVGELAWEVVKESRVADARVCQGYKISAEGFPRFRHAFERRFLQRLVGYATDEMLRRVREREERFRKETVRFISDPQIFTDVCELVCEAVYDFLYNDGFLDLPSDWRARLVS
jgi:hypothetical protein